MGDVCNHHSSSEKLGNAIIYVWHMKPGWIGVYVLSSENLHRFFFWENENLHS